MSATATETKPMMRFRLLGGKHYQTVKIKRPDGSEFESVREYAANDPTCNIIETDIDLEERYNQPGYEKFRREQDVGQELKGFDDDAFVNEVIARGFMSKEEAEVKRAALKASKAGEASPSGAGKPETQKKKAHPALANLAKTPLVGLQQLAEDEEIDVTNCKTDEQYRTVIRKVLESR